MRVLWVKSLIVPAGIVCCSVAGGFAFHYVSNPSQNSSISLLPSSMPIKTASLHDDPEDPGVIAPFGITVSEPEATSSKVSEPAAGQAVFIAEGPSLISVLSQADAHLVGGTDSPNDNQSSAYSAASLASNSLPFVTGSSSFLGGLGDPSKSSGGGGGGDGGGETVSSAVPEPSTWALMLLGFLVLGSAAVAKARPSHEITSQV